MASKDPASNGATPKKRVTRAKPGLTAAEVKKIVQEYSAPVRQDAAAVWRFKYGPHILGAIILALVSFVVYQGCEQKKLRQEVQKVAAAKVEAKRLDSSYLEMERERKYRDKEDAVREEEANEATEQRKDVQEDGKKKD